MHSYISNVRMDKHVFYHDIESRFANLLDAEYTAEHSENETFELINERLNARMTVESLTHQSSALFGQKLKRYGAAELLWYLSRRENVQDIPFATPEIWNRVTASRDGAAHSQYGKIVFGDSVYGHYPQFVSAVLRLIENPFSRRSIISYARDLELHAQADYSHVSKGKMYEGDMDFLCTMYSAHRLAQSIDGGYILHYTVHQRSCDAILGFKNDFAWHRMLMLIMYFILSQYYDMSCSINFCWNFDSLHIYADDVDKIAEYIRNEFAIDLSDSASKR